MTASTAATAIGAALPGATASSSPPAAPPTTPARPPPADAPAHRAAAIRAARRNRRLTSAAAAAIGAGCPRIGTSTGVRRSPSAYRAAARARTRDAAGCQGARSASDVPSACRQLGGFALLFFVAGVGRDAGHALQERLERIGGRRRRPDPRQAACDVRPMRPLVVVFLLQHVGKHEAVAVAGHRANEARLARVVAERPADRANRLAQRAVGDDHVVPHPVEDVAPMHRLVPAFDEKDEQIEIARNERPLVPAVDEHPAPRRKDEIAEAIARHSLRYRSSAIVSDEMDVASHCGHHRGVMSGGTPCAMKITFNAEAVEIAEQEFQEFSARSACSAVIFWAGHRGH